MSGQCACGNISWSSTSPAEHHDYCYCLTCQRVAGEPYIAWMGIPKAALTWTFKNENAVFTYSVPVGDTGICIAERTCCGNDGCNARLQYELYPEKTHVAVSTIVRNDFELPGVGCHIWCKRAPESYQIPEDGVPRYEEFDDVFQARMDVHLQSKRTSGPKGVK